MANTIPRLGVNIDHVATLRQARGENYPSLVDAAHTCLNNGADQITIHLREDRRHIQDIDIPAIQLVTKKFGKPLNLEMGCNQEIIDIATTTAPDWICIVPENREEKTTEGGLNILDQQIFNRVSETCELLRGKLPKIKISLFLEAKSDILKLATKIAPNAIEIHTGDYARTFLGGDGHEKYIDEFEVARTFLLENKIACHAGHGLTQESVVPLLKHKLFEEYNIGHWVICQAVFRGLGPTVKNLKKIFEKASVKV
ncbi:MAG: pyridoxine 5'-phosphate synthase [Bacteriovoracaceae bacterium]|nr:pyridoxine 5'-phosphate synthase [Bacteriovoracaceae bacterium]